MDHILVLNCGSSSVKFQVYGADGPTLAGGGMVEALFTDRPRIKWGFAAGEGTEDLAPDSGHEPALERVFALLADLGLGIAAVGHRVTAGGEAFSDSVVLDPGKLEAVERYAFLAPLHNPPNVMGVRFVMKRLPSAPNVGVFDTAFFARVPAVNHIYAVPYELYERHGIRRYGYHGTSYKFVSQETAAFLDRPLEELNMIICHLGSGSSAAAVERGVGVDCTLGFSTLAGLVMSTRSGTVDPAIPLFLIQKGWTAAEVERMLFHQSGLYGLCGEKDMRGVLTRIEAGDERAQLAFDIFCMKVKKTIGAFAAELGRVHALVFTAGIGENSPEVRVGCVDTLGLLGIELDEPLNLSADRGSRRIGAGPVDVLVIPTNEELMIARDTVRLALS